ncbi:MAG: hypothetical protein RJA20_1867 [Bacteroidota bacterium]|jgi:hypothetical protein
MKKIRRNSYAFRGTGRNERAPSALLPSNISMDGRETWQWLAFLSRAASLINFVDENNESREGWDAFLSADPSVMLARILEVRPDVIDSEIRSLVAQLHESTSEEYRIGLYGKLLVGISSVVEILNDWYIQAVRTDQFGRQNTIKEALGDIISNSLALEFFRFRNEVNIFRIAGVFRDYRVDKIFQHVHVVWLYDGEVLPRDILTDDPGRLIAESEPVVMRAYQQFYLAMVYIREKAVGWFGESLENNNRHAPHIGMLLTFFRLMEYAREQMNELPRKHLLHYYEEILHQTPHPAVPDRAVVCLQLAGNTVEFLLREHSEFSASSNVSGKTASYLSVDSLMLNHMEVSSFRTVFLSKNRELVTNSSFRIVTGIYSAPVANSGDGFGGAFRIDDRSWPIFGEEQLGKDESSRNMSDAETGFIIASPVLLLKEGKRDITVTYRFSEKSLGLLLFLLDDMASNLALTRSQVAVKIFSDAFRLDITGENGWFPLKRWSLSDADQWELQGGFSFLIGLMEDDPTIGRNNPAIHGFPDDTGWPLLKTTLHPDSGTYLYTFSRILEVLSVQIEVNVTGLKSLTFYNQTGLLDGSLPFQPFGPTPAKNAYLMIGSAELFTKRLTALTFQLNWNNLPDLDGGFQEYFREYNTGLGNDSFEVKMSALSNRSFNPKDAPSQPSFRLFESDGASGKLSDSTTIGIRDLQSLQLDPDYRLSNLVEYSNDTRSGYFRLMLEKPATGFGHTDYYRLFSAAMINQKQPGFLSRVFGIGKARPPVLPREPFVPVLNSVRVDYSAKTRLNLVASKSGENDREANEKIYTLHPFGYQEIFSAGRSLTGYLFPDFEHDAYLFLGLKEVLPGRPVSMFLDIIERRLSQNYQNLELEWSYLRRNNWEAFPGGLIQSDTTQNFSTSGIVRFIIPSDIEKGNTIMPGEYYWVRVAARGDLSIAGRLYAPGFNAIEVQWKDDADDNHFDNLGRQPRIAGLAKGIPEIQRVRQVTEYYGGYEREDMQDFLIRVSERLRHKGRGINSWDIERLLMQAFPFLRRVKCFTRMEYPELSPGMIRIVVFPEIREGETEPLVAFHQIKKMESYLSARISPFLRPEIINPVYDKLKVSCSLTLKKEFDSDRGKYLQQLHRDILGFLCPWLVRDASDAYIQFGGTISRNDMLSFIRERNYVSKVTRFSLVRISGNAEDGFSIQDTALDTQNDGILKSGSPWSVFSPVAQHDIQIMDNESYIAAEPSAIEGMRLGTDFVILEEDKQEPETAPDDQLTDSDEWFISPKS